MALKNIPDSGFAHDDGSAAPELAAALAAWSADRSAEPRVLAALGEARLLVPVVAVLGETEGGEVHGDTEGADVHGEDHVHGDGGAGARGGPGAGLRREKTSDMAVPTLTAGDRRALPAFTSTAALAAWDPAARPVAVPLHQALAAAAHEGADTLVLDLAGPVTYQLTGAALRALAEGRGSTDPLSDPAVTGAVRDVVAGEPAVVRAYLGPGSADGLLALVLDGDPAAPARAVAEALAAHETLRARLVRGLDLALLPADAPAPGEPLYVRGA